jgi:hypothetical protein
MFSFNLPSLRTRRCTDGCGYPRNVVGQKDFIFKAFGEPVSKTGLSRGAGVLIGFPVN